MRKIKILAGENAYPVLIGSGSTGGFGDALQSIRGFNPRQIIVFSNPTVFGLYGDALVQILETSGFECEVWLVPDGERFKTVEYLEKSLEQFAKVGLKRSDAVIALGGGVIGDLAGFASAIYMRGIAFIQIPTSLLAMVDSSVGGKTGVNSSFGKNLVGAFHHPKAVFVDVNCLKTLDARELRAGYYELVKHGAVGGDDLLNRTDGFLRSYPLQDYAENSAKPEFESELIELICAQITQKAKVVANDRCEDPARSDPNSRKILNYGHTVGHALEKVTEYSYFRHGEAVAYGMLTANEIAKRLEFCDRSSINLLNDVVLRVGDLPDSRTVDIDAVCDALLLDKKSLGESLQWVLLKRVGHPRILSGNEVSELVVRESLSSVLLTQ